MIWTLCGRLVPTIAAEGVDGLHDSTRGTARYGGDVDDEKEACYCKHCTEGV